MPIDIALKPSRYLRLAAWLVAAVAALAVLRLPLAFPLPVLLTLFLLLLCYCDLRAHQSVAGNSRLCCRGEQWLLEINGEQRPVILTGATVWQWLLALNFREPGSFKTHRLVVLADSCETDERRRLRVLLRNFPVFASG